MRRARNERAWRFIRPKLLGKHVRVYYNLHKHCLSVKYKNKVVGYTNYIVLDEITFRVSESGRQRVLAEQSKNVHAYVQGRVTAWLPRMPKTRCTYNPYKNSTFIIRNTQQPIHNAKRCCIVGHKIYTE